MKIKLTFEQAMQIYIASYWDAKNEKQKDRILKLMVPDILRLARAYDELEATSD